MLQTKLQILISFLFYVTTNFLYNGPFGDGC
jgi:hypothetical protein